MFATASPSSPSLPRPLRRRPSWLAAALLASALVLAPAAWAQDDDGGGGDPPAGSTCGGASRLLPDFESRPPHPNKEYSANAAAFDAVCIPEAWHEMKNLWQAPQAGIGPWPTVVVIDSGFFATDDSGIWPPNHPGYQPIGDASGELNPLPGTVPRWGFHGTSVLSLLASQANNDLLITGVAGSWKPLPSGVAGPVGARYLPVRVGAQNTATHQTLADAFDGVVLTHPEVRVVNLSQDLAGQSPPPGSRIEQMLQHADTYEITVVTSAGNAREVRSADDWVRQFDNVIVVGALNHQGTDLWIENAMEGTATGPGVDLYAPGADMTVIERHSQTRVASGTSYAAPLVSGVVAMMHNADPYLNTEEVRGVLLETADKVTLPGGDSVLRLNAHRAVLCASKLVRWSSPPWYSWGCDVGQYGGWLTGSWKAW